MRRRTLLVVSLLLALFLILAAALYSAARMNYHILELRVDGAADGLTILDMLEPEYTGELERNRPEVESGEYILSLKTGKFHRPNCENVARIQPENREVFLGDRELLLELGFSPCGLCKP